MSDFIYVWSIFMGFSVYIGVALCLFYKLTSNLFYPEDSWIETTFIRGVILLMCLVWPPLFIVFFQVFLIGLIGNFLLD